MAHLAEGAEELIAPLLELADGADSDLSRAASVVLEEHPAPAVREALLRAATFAGNATAMRIVRDRGDVPEDPAQRALFLFLATDWRAYRESDPDRSRLRAALESAPDALRRQLQDAAEAGGVVRIKKDWQEDTPLASTSGWSGRLAPDNACSRQTRAVL